MEAERGLFPSGILVAEDMTDTAKNNMNRTLQLVNLQGWQQFQFILKVFLIKYNQYQNAFIFLV